MAIYGVAGSIVIAYSARDDQSRRLVTLHSNRKTPGLSNSILHEAIEPKTVVGRTRRGQSDNDSRQLWSTTSLAEPRAVWLSEARRHVPAKAAEVCESHRGPSLCVSTTYCCSLLTVDTFLSGVMTF